MQQIYYTSCRAGQSWNGSAGYQIRAASADLRPGQVTAAIPYMGYRLPAALSPLPLAETLPVRLAYFKTSLGKVLCHSVSAGLDPTTRRSGNFFSHLLLALPSGFTAASAIRTWGSQSWQRTDGDFQAALPEIFTFPNGQILTDAALRRFLSTPRGETMFRFVLAATLAGKTGDRIFIAAPSQEIAWCIFGLTRVLPATYLSELTFSTYEARPLSCPARVVGTWAGDSAETDMPLACYSGSAFGYNQSTGRTSPMPPEGDFVDLATAALRTGHRQALEHVLSVWDQCGLKWEQRDLLDLVCRGERGDALTGDDLQRLGAGCPRYVAHLWNRSAIGPQSFDEILNTSTAPLPWISHLVDRRDELGPSLTEALVQTTARTFHIEASSLAEQWGAGIWELLSETAASESFLSRLLDEPVEKSLANARVMSVLQALGKRPAGPWQFSEAVQDKLESILSLHEFLLHPKYEPAVVQRLASALRNLPPSPAVAQSIDDATRKVILAEHDSPRIYELIENTMTHWGPVAPGGIDGFYQRLVERLARIGDWRPRRYLLCATIAAGLSVSQSERVVAITEKARDVAEEAVARSPRLFDFMDRQSHAWPAEARLRWNLFAKFLRPQGLFSRFWHGNCSWADIRIRKGFFHRTTLFVRRQG